MSFQAYLDIIESNFCLTPHELVTISKSKGFDNPKIKSVTILEWLRANYDLGRGPGMALVHVITKGQQIDAKYVGSGGSHNDESDLLWLDGRIPIPPEHSTCQSTRIRAELRTIINDHRRGNREPAICQANIWQDRGEGAKSLW